MRVPEFFSLMALIAIGLQPTYADASSVPHEYSRSYTACMNKVVSTTDVVECIGVEHKAQDRNLNAAYKALMGSLSSERQKQLRTAQRAWITYRDANCDFYFDPDGGTIARLQANECVLSMTAQRAAELQAFGKLE